MKSIFRQVFASFNIHWIGLLFALSIPFWIMSYMVKMNVHYVENTIEHYLQNSALNQTIQRALNDRDQEHSSVGADTSGRQENLKQLIKSEGVQDYLKILEQSINDRPENQIAHRRVEQGLTNLLNSKGDAILTEDGKYALGFVLQSQNSYNFLSMIKYLRHRDYSMMISGIMLFFAGCFSALFFVKISRRAAINSWPPNTN